MNAPRGAPSPWRRRLIDGCHRAKRQIGNKERGVAPWHMPSRHPAPQRREERNKERERGKWGVGEYDRGEVERPRWKHPVRILGGFYDVD